MNLSKTNTRGKDINWINALKALCILFVFLRHSEGYYGCDLGWFDGLILPFYVNAFFSFQDTFCFGNSCLLQR